MSESEFDFIYEVGGQVHIAEVKVRNCEHVEFASGKCPWCNAASEQARAYRLIFFGEEK
jgi:hypothetical protein